MSKALVVEVVGMFFARRTSPTRYAAALLKRLDGWTRAYQVRPVPTEVQRVVMHETRVVTCAIADIKRQMGGMRF